MICEIQVKVSFLKHTIVKKDSGVVEGDYNSTKLVFEFEEDVAGKRIAFNMNNPDGELVLSKDLEGNEVNLTGFTQDGKAYSLFNSDGQYPFELVLFGEDKQLTSATGWLNASKRIVSVGTGVSMFDQGFEQGKQAEYDRFWDAYQENGNRQDYTGAFSGNGWTRKTLNPKYDIVPLTATHIFSRGSFGGDLQYHLESIGKKLDFSQATTLVEIVYYTSVTRLGVIDARSVSSLASTFAYALDALTTIDLLILKDDGSQTFGNNSFINCRGLINMIIQGVIGKNGLNLQWSTKLSHDSLMSIINALQDKSTDTSGTIWEVTIGSENYAKLTEDEIALAEQKGWLIG